jgi:hypothetical protein
MSFSSFRNRAKWFAPGIAIIFVLIDFFGSRAYPMWQGMRFPVWLDFLFIAIGLSTLFLAVICIPKWQSFVAWAALLLVAWHAIVV